MGRNPLRVRIVLEKEFFLTLKLNENERKRGKSQFFFNSIHKFQVTHGSRKRNLSLSHSFPLRAAIVYSSFPLVTYLVVLGDLINCYDVSLLGFP